MERAKARRISGLLPRLGPYLISVLIVLMGEYLIFGSDLPISFLVFVVATALAIAVFLLNPYLAILGLFVIKPVLDMMWGTYTSGGFKGTWLIGSAGPLLWALGMLYFKISPLDYRLGRTMIFWGACCLLPAILIPFSQSGVAPLAGIAFSLKLLSGWGFYFLVPFLAKNKVGFRLFLFAWLISSIVPALAGLYYLFSKNPWGYQITAGWWRLAGPYHDAAAFLTEITPSLPIMLYMASGTKPWWKRLVWIIPIFIWAILAFNTFTRSFWIASAIVLIIWSFYGLWHFLVPVGFWIIYQWPIIFRRFTTAGIESVENPYAFGGRLGIWEIFWKVFKAIPWPDKLLGYWAFSQKRFWKLPDLHNQYIQVIFHQGLIGFVSFIALMWGFLYYILRMLISEPKRRREALLGVSALVFAIVLSGTGDYFFVPNNQWFLFGLLGFLVNPELWHNEGT